MLRKTVGNWVDGDRFFDRKAEITELEGRVRDGTHTLLGGIYTKVPSQAASAYGSGATHGPTAHVCAPAAITPAAKMFSAALTSRSATKPQHRQR